VTASVVRYGRSVNPGPILLVVGAPAVGKSTVSRALARRFERSVHLPVDDLRDMVASGRILPSPDWNAALIEQIGLARRSAVAMALRYADAGFAVVLDDFWDPPGLVEYRELRDGRTLHRVLLRPPRGVALARNHGRHGEDPIRPYLDEGIKLVYDLYDAAAEQLDREGWLVLDNAALSPDDAASRIVAAAGLSPLTDAAR
jgi:chloramphenicol 3-O-phosphotransferase